MPKSKPPRRQRPRHTVSTTRALLDLYDKLERLTAGAAQEAERLADRVPPEEMAVMRATRAENRRVLAEARADVLTPSRTPVLDRLVGQARRKAAGLRTRP